MTVYISPVGGAGAQFFTNTGAVLTGGKLYTYAAGTTTPQVTYTTSAGNVAWTNPIVLDAAGRVPSGGEIWLTSALYKFVLKDANDVLIATYDNISGINTTPNATSIPFTGFNGQSGFVSVLGTATGADWVGYTPAGTNANPRTAQDKLRDVVSVKDFGAIGDGVADDTVAIQTAITNASAGTIYFPAGTYLISAEITCTTKSLQGEGQDSTTIKASAAIGTMLTFGNRNTIDGFYFNGDSKANYCITVAAGNGSCIKNCRIEFAKKDGVVYSATGNNNQAHIENCLVRNHGSTYSTGSASSVAAGSYSTVTITGAADLTTIVQVVDANTTRSYFKVVGQAAREIVSCTANTLTVYPALSPEVSSVTYQIIQGSCILIDRQGDNSKINIKGCTFQTALAGINDQALYGCVSESNIFEVLQFGIIEGFRGNGSSVVFNPSNKDAYFEVIGSYDVYWAYAVNAYSIGKTAYAFTYFIGTGSTVEFYTPKITTSSVSTSTINGTGLATLATVNSGTYVVNTATGAQNVVPASGNDMFYLFAVDSSNTTTISTAIATKDRIYETYDNASVFTWSLSGGYIQVDAGGRVVLVSVLKVN